MNKAKLVKELRDMQTKLSNEFNNDVCENWSLDGFLEHIDNCIVDIEEEDIEE